jgi:hypothetical protein
VLAFCIFEKSAYLNAVAPAVYKLKFDFWGHDCPVLHSHEIRKARGDFNILLNAETRAGFMARLNGIMEQLPCTIIAAAIDKHAHARRYVRPANPYEIALGFCMERLQRWLGERGQAQGRTHVIVECRGRTEDQKLELEFRRIAPMAKTRLARCPTSTSASWKRSTMLPACKLPISSRIQ